MTDVMDLEMVDALSSDEEDIQAFVRRNLGKNEVLLTDETREAMQMQQADGERRIYNSEMLEQKCEEIKLPCPAKLDRVPWFETMALTTERKGEDKDASKDVEREAKFHDATMEAVKEGYRRLQVMGIPASRPADFYADMFKHDKQMEKVRARIAYESKAIDIVETRKKRQSEKKFAKQVQAERVLEKMKERKEQKEQVEAWKRKTGKLDGKSKTNGELGASDGEDDDEFTQVMNKHQKKLDEKVKKDKFNHKRAGKDKKYGFGGRKRGLKRNDHDSWAKGLAPAKQAKGGKGRGGKGKKPRKHHKGGKS